MEREMPSEKFDVVMPPIAWADDGRGGLYASPDSSLRGGSDRATDG